MTTSSLGGLSKVVVPIDGIKTVASAGTPEALVATDTFVQSVELYAQKAQFTDNAGDIGLGWSATNGTQYKRMAAGDKFSMTAGEGNKLNLAAVYIDVVTAGDGVSFVALP